MKKDKYNIILLLKRLLEITEKEQEDIAKSNIDKLEHYNAIKKDIINEIEVLKKDKAWIAQNEDSADIESILNKINTINNANSAAVRIMQDKVKDKMRDQNSRKTAINAYNKLA